MARNHLRDLPSSEACLRNRDPILRVLKDLGPLGRVLEIGYGTAEHAEYFSRDLDGLESWLPADRKLHHWVVLARKANNELPKLLPPIELWVSPGGETLTQQLERQKVASLFDTVYSANSIHIMNDEQVAAFCRQVGDLLKREGKLLLYGPFSYNGKHKSISNREFHESLRARGEGSGLKDFDWLCKALRGVGLEFVGQWELPANNDLLVWEKN